MNSGADPNGGEDLVELLRRVGIDPKKYATLSEHDQRVVMRMAERLGYAENVAKTENS